MEARTVAEEMAGGGVAAAVRQLLRERAREGKAPEPPRALEPSQPAEAAEPDAVGTPEQLSVAELRELFERRMYGLLIEPETLQAIRRTLRSRDPKASRELLAVILSALMPHQKASSSGPARITFISKVDRSGVNTTATKIETPH